MALHFLAATRVRKVELDSMPGCICLLPGVLMAGVGDWLDVEGHGRFRALKIEWTGPDSDEACITVEAVAGR